MGAYLQTGAYLDEGLYNDFYGLWIALMVINSIIFLAGMILNSVALYVFCFRTKQKTTSVIYTINLAVTDLLVNLSLPTRILLYSSRGRCVTCSYLHIFSYFVNMYCSILFLTASVEASRKWRNSSVAKCVCVSVWLFAIVVTYSLLSTAFQQTAASPSSSSSPSLSSFCPSSSLLSSLCASCGPWLTDASCSRAGKEKDTGISLLRLTRLQLLMIYISLLFYRERRRRAVQLLSTVLIIFTVCFTPFHIRQVVVYFYPDMPHHALVYHLTVTLSSLNSCMDPVVYCFVTNNFQATVRHFFRRAEPEVTSGDIVSMQHSSKASGRTANPVTNNGITMKKIPALLRKTM
ncbi:hypothetical protein WMY93_025987 [Mugilogobius chulae]|uniref:G-protein coupled receptors family 1 profile domain-containing protein n=1 Tax=Mugilogobius chulae TaxID=88201 RepID=A0AAW0MWD2_9GOBI